MSRTHKDKPIIWFTGGVPSWFKRMNRREERSRQNQALREDKDIPIFRKRDAYEYW
jgi:hypothetical protein